MNIKLAMLKAIKERIIEEYHLGTEIEKMRDREEIRKIDKTIKNIENKP